MDCLAGVSFPLGATFDGVGANFAVYAPAGEAVELCLFDEGGETRLALPEAHGYQWHGYLPIAEPGLRYGYRVHGPFDPGRGVVCNPAKLLLDPYARAIDGPLEWHEALRTVRVDDRSRPDERDSAPHVPRCVLTNPYFDWRGDRSPGTPLEDSVIYEAHVKGATARHPDVEPDLRGSYLGLAQPAFIEHLRRLGVTAVELLPVHQFLHDGFPLGRGLRNYWGYHSVGFFAPHAEYAALGTDGAQVAEFKRMVMALHAAGIEVILDVVFNHTGEGNLDGPTVCFRGFDGGYYRTEGDDQTRYIDFTGTGNTLDTTNPWVLQLVMDSLRYWVTEMHVDGFRFDLAATLAREHFGVDRLSAFFDVVQQDPVVGRVKLIAEPWDIGPGGYQVGNFPPQWSEWNGRYRDTVRDYWRSVDGTLSDLATRIAGSSDLYGYNARTPYHSVNFVTAHDGFTLADLVSYNHKHNEANGEGSRDGSDDNRSWNCGVEGPTDDPGVLALRARQQRNFLTTLALSQGVPMLLGGDEHGRTQHGNNNAYCQDSELSWLDWDHVDEALCAFTARVIALRRAHAVFRCRRFLTGRVTDGGPLPDSVWLQPDGTPMGDADWRQSWVRCMALFLNGDACTERGPLGQQRPTGTFYLCFNAHWEPVTFTLPPAAYGERWAPVIDTRDWDVPVGAPPAAADDTIELLGRSIAVLERRPEPAVATQAILSSRGFPSRFALG